VNSSNPEFWNTRYRSEKTPWDFHGIPKALQEFLQSTTINGRVLIPGCGSAYEIKAFADAGWDPVGIDFSQAGVERAKNHLGVLGEKVIYGNFFEHDFGREKFDLIYERTFLCSMSPDRWPEYGSRIAELLKEGGILAGFFLYGEESSPPPFPMVPEQLGALLGNQFQLVEKTPSPDALKVFSGKEERWEIWKRAYTGSRLSPG
jgi:hypothetical protein